MKLITQTFLLLLFITSLHADQSSLRFKTFTKFVDALHSKSEIEKVIKVNGFFNHYRYISDKTNYKKTDYWATKDEFIKRGKGDCEDFAIAKYFTLLDLGVSASKLSLVMAKFKGQLHVVLSYRYNNTIYYLDNMTNKIKSKRNDLKILFTVSKDNNNSMSEKIASYKWNDVLKRV